jgi:hypothetical protein
MKTFYKVSMIVVFLLFCTDELINGQTKVDGYSINPKLGGFIGKTSGGFGGGEINILSTNKFIYSIDYYHYEDYKLFTNPTEKYNQIDLLIGKYIGDRYLRFQYQGGLGTFWGFKRGEKISGTHYEKVDFFTLGIPVKLGFKLLPARFISIGIDLQANLNFKKPIGMAALSIEIGKLRNKINTP